MRVYRYLCEQEYKNILSSNFEKVGKVYDAKNLSNSFKYKKNEPYLHFFKDKESLEEIKNLYKNDGKDYYICTFDIPFFTLVKGAGKGYYGAHGYDFDYEVKREFIV